MKPETTVTLLVIQAIMALFFGTIYLYADAMEDNKNADNYGGFDHKRNASVRIIGLGSIYLFSVLFSLYSIPLLLWVRVLASLLCLGIGWSWLAFDVVYNKINNVAATHIGSGNIDLWFKAKFGQAAEKWILSAKLVLIAISAIAFALHLSLIN